LKWEKIETDRSEVVSLSRKASLPMLLATILVSRGIRTPETARVFLQPRISDLHDPCTMDDMEKATERLCTARARGERVFLFGDYDVDGVSSTAAMGKVLESLGLAYAFCHPDRLREGYGFNSRGVRLARETGATLIIALDCGTEDVAPVEEARANGIDVIVIDHHHQKGELSPATAIVNPKKRRCPYPFEGLVSAGIVLKFARALVEKISLDIRWGELLQLAALATVADVAPLREENRLIAMLGLREINRAPLPGLSALARAAGIHGKRIATGQLAFQFGPRINAAGRLGAPELATEILLESNPRRCHVLADRINRLNSKRQSIERGVADEVIRQIEQSGAASRDKVLIASGPGWHRGVVGIVASRLLERYHRPAIVLAIENGMGYGSARSIPGFDMFNALSRCRELFSTFGGHRLAAGISIEAHRIEPFRKMINEIAEESLSEDDLLPRITVDETVWVEDIDFELLRMMERLEPFGLGNPRPVLASMAVRLLQRPCIIGRNRDHIKLRLGPSEAGGQTIECVGWNMAGRLPGIPGDLLDIAYFPQINEWRNEKRIQLVLKDIKAAGISRDFKNGGSLWRRMLK
jgi:single-stranded-DNA-specific exonuclease